MISLNIKKIAQRLTRKYGTHDSIQIAEELGYLVIYTPLVDIRGFHQFIERCHIIYLDNSLCEKDMQFVCAHEIGHALLHTGMNRVFMDQNTLMVSNRYETEANQFAVDLIYDDHELQNYFEFPLSTIASCLGISEQLAAYRLQSVNPVLFTSGK